MNQLLSHWLRIQPDERRRTAFLFVLLFCTTSYIIVGRTARDALLLARDGVDQLPLMYIGIALASSALVLVYNHLLARIELAALLRTTLLSTAVALLGLWWLLRLEWAPASSLLYIFMEVTGSMLVVEFWTFAYESFSTREARRLFGIIGSGGVMAGTLGGFGGGWLAPRIGTVNLLLICIVALGIGLLVLRRIPPPQKVTGPRDRGRSSGAARALPAPQRRYVLLLASFLVVTSMSVSIVDFEFKALAQQQFGEAELAAFFGKLYGSCGLLAFVAQLTFTGRLLTRLGMLPAMLVLPGVLLAGGAALVFAPVLGPAVALKAGDSTLRYSLHDTCVQLLYLPLPVLRRRGLKAVIDGAVKPVALATTGVMLAIIGSSPAGMQLLALVMIGGLVAWVVLAIALRREYVQALLSTLDVHRGLDEELPPALIDLASQLALTEALRSGDARVVLNALELLPSSQGREWEDRVLPLLLAPQVEVRLAARDFCQLEGISIPSEVIRAWAKAPDVALRAAATELLGPGAELEPILEDPAPTVRARAIVGLVRRAVDAHANASLELLQEMIASSDPLEREAAAWAMGEMKGPEAGLRSLLADPAPSVVEAAIQAAGRAQILDLVPVLVDRLRDHDLGSEAAAAIGHYGEVALPSVLALFPLRREDEDLRIHAFIALRSIGTRRVIEELLRRLPEDRHVRLEMLQASMALIRRQDQVPLPLDQVRGPLLSDVRDWYQWWGIARELGQGRAWELLQFALPEELQAARERVFLLLSHAYPVKPIQSLYRALSNPRTTMVANALEAADELLEPELRLFIMPLLEQLTLEERLRRGRVLFTLVTRTPEGWVEHFLSADEPWLVWCAVSVVQLKPLPLLLPRVQALTAHSNGEVREAAAACVSEVLSESERRAWWETIRQSDDPRLRRTAQRWLSQKESKMISSVEKVLFLKRVDLFSQLPGRELMNLATIAEQVAFPEGSVIFEEGDEGDSLYLVLQGQVAVSRGGEQIATLGTRECFGEMAILDREPRSATVTALEDVSALRIERDSFHDLLAHKREISLAIIRILVVRLRNANRRGMAKQRQGD